MTISVIGLGKLGLPLACIFAHYGRYKVIGIDHDEKLINVLEFGVNPIKETGLTTLLSVCKKNIVFTQKYDILGDITFIVVPTPSVNDKFSSAYIEEALDKIKTKQKVVIVSTIMPGEIDRLQIRYPHLQLAYNPAFIALGNVIDNFTNPDFILIGSKYPKITKLLKEIHNKICFAVNKFAVLLPLEAEIAKLALNCYLTTKITFANQIGNLCHRLGISGKKVCQAIALDSRIGSKYFTPGLGYGGPCLPRDNSALKQVMDDNEVFNYCEMIDSVNDYQVIEIYERIKHLKPKTVGFKSLSYKKNTQSTDNSQLEVIHNILKDYGYKVVIGKGDVNLDWGGII